MPAAEWRDGAANPSRLLFISVIRWFQVGKAPPPLSTFLLLFLAIAVFFARLAMAASLPGGGFGGGSEIVMPVSNPASRLFFALPCGGAGNMHCRRSFFVRDIHPVFAFDDSRLRGLGI